MPADAARDSLSDALVDSIKNGTQPDPEAVALGELSPETLRKLAKQLQQARKDVEGDIKAVSKQSAPDVNRWIAEAKQLRADVRDSQDHADKIKEIVASGAALTNSARDARNKVIFLRRELAFHQGLGSTLEKILVLKTTIEQAQDATVKLKIKEGIELLQKSQSLLSKIPECRQTGLLSLLQAKIADVYHVLSNLAYKYWDELNVWSQENRTLRVKEMYVKWRSAAAQSENPEKPDILIYTHDVIFVLQAIGAMKGRLTRLVNDIILHIVRPRLRGKWSVGMEGPFIRTVDTPPNSSIETTISAVSDILNFFDLVTVDAMTPQLLEILAPEVISELIAGPLAEAVPPDLSGIPKFSELLTTVQRFSKTVKARKWPGSAALDVWVEHAPKIWLQRRSDGTLKSVRQILGRGLGRPRAVERVETQKVSVNDEVFNDPNTQDDWDASWSDDENAGDKAGTPSHEKPADHPSNHEDEDGGDDAWGFDDEDAEDKPKESAEAAPKADDADEDDAWGWGENDDDEQEQPPSTQETTAKAKSSKAKGDATKKPAQEREVTLRETYYVTSVPEQIVEMVVQVVEDAQNLLSLSDPGSNPIQPAGEGLISLPRDVLSMFRACAPAAYEIDPNGNMYLYNDSLWLAEQLRAFSTHHAQRASSAALTNEQLSLEADAAALEAFGRRAYGREMERQRTVLRDLLDGAQGFAHCTEEPFAEQCEVAVSSAADWLRGLHAQWRTVAAPSALLQSTGSLYSTVTNKLMLDVGDLSDISEPESHRLVELCRRLEGLQRLFLPEEEVVEVEKEDDDESEEARAKAAMAASVYTPGLLKFHWLTQILEGSLADIRFWWSESELSLAFPAAEVVDLIEALFADTEHRRKAIAEIRRGT